MRILWRFVLFLVVTSIAIIGVAGVLFLEGSPRVAQMGAPTPDDVITARQFVRDLRDAGRSPGGASPSIAMSEADLNSIIKLGGRMVPGFRGRLQVGLDDVLVEFSAPVPGTGEALWLNASVVVPEFERALSFESVRVGSTQVPPGLALGLGRVGADLIVGNEFGTTILASASGMLVANGQLTFALEVEEMGKNGVFRGFFASLRGQDLPWPDQIEHHYARLREAMDRGELPVEGSYLPYLKFTLGAALSEGQQDDPDSAFTAAIFALTRICGARDFRFLVGELAGGDFDDARTWQTDCSKLTLNGRVDSRRHFTTAAALQAASNRGFAVSVGEFKELFDTVGSGGFDFTDIAANNSGIRLANRFMLAPVEDWPGLLQRIQAEADVIVGFDGIPPIMTGAAFEAQFGSIESPAYLAEVEKIEAEIAQLGLHTPN